MHDQMPPGTTLAVAAKKVADLAAEHAAEADKRRRLAPEVASALVSAGFARHGVPEALGGAGSSFPELLRALITVGGGCASASWCGLSLASSGRIAAFLPPRGQEEIWRDGPDVPIAAALPPAGAATRVDGGWQLTGRWAFVSAIDFAEWVLVCVLTDGRPTFCAVPKRDFTVEDTWFTVGMRGTGSRTVVLDGAFVPDHLTCAQPAVVAGRNDHVTDPAYQVSVLGSMPPLFAAPALGAALGALPVWADAIGRKSKDGRPAPRYQEVLAQTAAELDSARLLVERASETAGDLPGEADIARTARDASMAAELTRVAIERLFSTGGTSMQVEGHPVERAWRDVHCAVAHTLLKIDVNSAHFAKLAWPAG
ncbi:acyl-CoA dehydrogenase family protein [Saccharothrix deserti]|uniref:acyl-CoA dehydrogenase family protein n=1 Tax=Saccharothrix deserti TaxID=2593674 RepID=UPI00131C9973|nr:acyl-CoA dehydrogenase family protein [Saccharothrix deserti]